MEKPYFVMLWNQGATQLVPMCSEKTGELEMFETLLDATECAQHTTFGANFGYEIFEVGCGVECG